ncbi:hypothetical protein [Streptomyces puniciscabiei]|uniref:hypothetical protein n=1 Tax=Streptomyces puniciscabiei TaxID=164348 RepID=UPI00131E4D91|nr:hypothetical protein [Streptomyces puniciscabiei]
MSTAPRARTPRSNTSSPRGALPGRDVAVRLLLEPALVVRDGSAAAPMFSNRRRR